MEMVVAVGEAIDGMRPEAAVEALEEGSTEAVVGAVAQLARVVSLLILFTRHPGQEVLEVGLSGRLIQSEDLAVEVEVSHRVAVLRARIPVGEIRGLTVDLIQDDLAANAARYEGVEGARSCLQSAQTGARALEALREGAAHRRKRRLEGE